MRMFSEQMEALWRHNATNVDRLKASEPLIRILNRMADEWEERGGTCTIYGTLPNNYTFKANDVLKAADFKILIDEHLGDTEYIFNANESDSSLQYCTKAKGGQQIRIYAVKETFKGCIKIEEEEFVPASEATKIKRTKIICGS